jgi:hypothetical protein
VADLVSALLFIASDLEEKRAYPYSGAIRRAAARLQELEAVAPAGAPDTCARCGKPLKQRSTGRPRKWCSERCRRRKVPQTKTLREVS